MSENNNNKSEPNYELEWTLSTTCRCEYYDEKYDEYKPTYDCLGCFDEDLSEIKKEVLSKWADANGLFDPDHKIKIVGSGMTWRGVSGYKVATLETLISSLYLDRADFTLYFHATSDYKSLKVVRSSHDELGAGFEFEPLSN